MKNTDVRDVYDLPVCSTDEAWGAVVTTVGRLETSPGTLPPCTYHPQGYRFSASEGRILKEFQLLYISKGTGYFESKSCPKTRVTAGTAILLFPDEWHTYYPDSSTGWTEYWIGFRGSDADSRAEAGFFSAAHPLFRSRRMSPTLINLYQKVIGIVRERKSGYQPLISSIALFMLSILYYKERNREMSESYMFEKLMQARFLMQESAGCPASPRCIAESLGVSYSRFRLMFKAYFGYPPAQYQILLRHLRAKELIGTTEQSISEIAVQLNFETVGQFCSYFRKIEGISPAQYRKITFSA